MLYDDFDMLYDDWMTISDTKIRKTDAAKDMLRCAILKYPDIEDKEINENYDRLYNKALTTHQKLAMMMFAEYNIYVVKSDFESTQNMDISALYGMGNTSILFYVESMIVFARNALDIASNVYADLIFNKRLDSFNDFSKLIMKTEDEDLLELKQYFEENSENDLSPLRLLCGIVKGRALRDIIVHQANVRLEYHEYKENSEKECLFLALKNIGLIELDLFVSDFIDGVEEMFNITNYCCEKFLKSKMK